MIPLLLALTVIPESGTLNTPFEITIGKDKISLEKGIEELKGNPYILFLDAVEKEGSLHFVIEPIRTGSTIVALAGEKATLEVIEQGEMLLSPPKLLSLDPVIPFELTQTNETYFNLLQANEPHRNVQIIKLKTFPWVPLMALLAIGTLLPAGIHFLRLKTKKELPPEEEAWEELKELQVKKYTSAKDLYEDLTDLVREYIEKKYRLPVSHLTTEEFFHTMPSLKGLNEASLKYFLTEADKVKFAQKVPTPKEVNALVQSAQQLISSPMSLSD